MSKNISKSNALLDVQTGRNASRIRRAQLVAGKTGLPPIKERVRANEHNVKNKEVIVESTSILPSAVLETKSTDKPLAGRDASRARRATLTQGKGAILEPSETVMNSGSALDETDESIDKDDCSCSKDKDARSSANPTRSGSRNKGNRNKGNQERTRDAATRPSGRLRNADPIEYPPKVAESESYAGHKVTGVRIGRGENVTGDERGAAVQVTGIQYIGKETGYNPREGGTKVGASKTVAGQTVTGTQVRSKVSITGDESNPELPITGASDQELNDDLLQHREQGNDAVQTQFQRQNDPHGHTVFGANLGRSVKTIGSRNRNTEYSKEESVGGRPITGTAVGRSELTTGDESGSCHDITGSQYLIPAVKQPLCEKNGREVANKVGISHTLNGTRTTGTQVGQRIPKSGNITGTAEEGICQNISGTEYSSAEQYTSHCGMKPSRAGNENGANNAITWGGQSVTGVDIEHNENVTGDEPGACNVITGTPYAGPNQYQTFCSVENEEAAERRVSSEMSSGNHVSGDLTLNVDQVSGTQRGSEKDITGTSYYCVNPDKDISTDVMKRLKKINSSFSVKSPQREYQELAGVDTINAPTAESLITGAFSIGEGKITGNPEFHFQPRSAAEANARVTGEGSVEGRTITGSAWTSKANVTGTEGHIAAERNPSERQGSSHAFANSKLFKDKGGSNPDPTHHVTGMVGWSPKTSARITYSGGAQG
tara:strand:- start:756 stop:2903 length:2148 start_codon:yes stop_codon:yes gene_type:complete